MPSKFFYQEQKLIIFGMGSHLTGMGSDLTKLLN